MGLTWAAGWAIAGLLIGVSSVLLPFLPWDSFFEVFDAPLPALASPGFVGGALFSIVLGIVGRGRSFHELSLPRFTAWGAVGGVLLTLFPFGLIAAGLASTEGGRFDAWEILAAISVPFILLSAVSAAVSLMLARKAEARGAVAGEMTEPGPAPLDVRSLDRPGPTGFPQHRETPQPDHRPPSAAE
jgi:hypothetical protein